MKAVRRIQRAGENLEGGKGGSLEEETAGVEVGLVELVWHCPPDGPELAPLLRHAARECARKRLQDREGESERGREGAERKRELGEAGRGSERASDRGRGGSGGERESETRAE